MRSSRLALQDHRGSVTGFADAADLEGATVEALQDGEGLAGVFRRHTDDHAHATVEGAQHFRIGDIALLLQPFEDGRAFPGVQVDDGLGALRQNPRQVLHDTAAGDVSNGVYLYLGAQGLDGLDVDLGGHQQGRTQGAVAEGRFQIGPAHFDYLADKRVTVRVGTGGVQGDQYVTRFDASDLNDLILFYHPDGEAGQVIVVLLVHAGHLGGLAADQRTARLHTALADTLYHVGGQIDIQAAGGVVVQEEQG